MTLKDRLSRYIKYKGFTPSKFESYIGMSNGSFSKMGDNTRKSTLDRISKGFPDLNIAWLQTGVGSMLNDESEPKANAELLGIATQANTETTVPVRFFEPEPSATFREFCVGVNEAPDSINIIPEPSDHIDDRSCVFRVSGDSMSPQIQDNAKVLCREIIPSRWHYVKNGVIAIVYDDRFVIKRVRKNCLDNDNYILLCSDNPEYPQTERAYLGSIRCMYEVIRVISQRVY